MKIEAGKKYKTRGGDIAAVAAHNPDANDGHKWVGWCQGEVVSWHDDGSFDGPGNTTFDLVAEHREPREWTVGVRPSGSVTEREPPDYDWSFFLCTYPDATIIRVREVLE